MASEKPDVSEGSEKSQPKSGLKDRTRNICRRFWWLFLIIFVIIVLCIVLPIIFVKYPDDARDAVRDSGLNITSMSILNPSPDSVELTVEEQLSTTSSYHPTFYPFDASLYLLDNSSNPSFTTIRTPQFRSQNDANITVGPQRANVTNMEQFTRFVLAVAGGEKFSFGLRGNGQLKQGGLPRVGFNYDKNITMKGLNGLEGFSLLSFQLLNTTEADGTNAKANVSIPNPSVLTIALGNVTLALSANGTAVGTATLPDLVLEPGENIKEMRSEVYELVVAGIVLAAKNPILPVDIVGNTSTFAGKEIPYYTTMLGETRLKVDIDVSKAMGGSMLV